MGDRACGRPGRVVLKPALALDVAELARDAGQRVRKGREDGDATGVRRIADERDALPAAQFGWIGQREIIAWVKGMPAVGTVRRAGCPRCRLRT